MSRKPYFALSILWFLALGGALGAEEITVAVFDGAAPISFTDDGGNAAGLMPEILERLLFELGYDPVFVTGVTFEQALERVSSGLIDILPGAVYSVERGELLDFNEEPFIVAWGQLGVLPGKDFAGLLDLRHQPIGLMRDGQNAANFIDLMERFDIPFEEVYFSSFPEIAEAIQDGTVTAGVFFNTWFRTAEGIVPSSIVFTPTQGFIATAKGTNAELVEAIDRRLRELKEDENSYYYGIINHWLSQETAIHVPGWVWIAIGATMLGLALSLSGSFFLRRQIRRATQDLTESRERYKTIADYAYGWEFWNGPDGEALYVSPNSVEITGYEASQFLESPGLVEQIIVPEDRQIWRTHLEEVHTAGASSDRSHCMVRIRTAEGELRWIEHRCTRVESSTGAYLGRRGSNNDITSRVVQEQALERGIHEKEVMLQEIHHRVKNNLQMISSLISLQKGSIDNEETLLHLDAINARIESIAALHSTLYQDTSFVSVDMGDYLRAIASRVLTMRESNRAVEYEISVSNVELSISKALPCGLITNEALINAYKYAFVRTETGRITISMHAVPDDRIRLRIRDDGDGAPREILEAEDSRGIGLRLISALAEQLGGALQIDGVDGVTIEVEFPSE
jgi:PAS domain S-box-containing protein